MKILMHAGKGLMQVMVIGAIMSWAGASLWALEQAGPAIGAGGPVAKGPVLASQLPDVESTYTLQKGDRIKITIYPEDNYMKGGEMEISSEGNITLPLIGKIPIAGQNVIEAEKVIAGLIGEDYLVDPEVVIEVLRHKEHSVVLLGQIRKPGTYTFPEGSSQLTLLQAVALAGGFSDIANVKKIKIVRKINGKSNIIRANASSIIGGKEADVDLQAGDVIHVTESLF